MKLCTRKFRWPGIMLKFHRAAFPKSFICMLTTEWKNKCEGFEKLEATNRKRYGVIDCSHLYHWIPRYRI